MSFTDKTLITTADSTPGPQYYNKISDTFEGVEGISGALNNIGPRVIYSYSGSNDATPNSFGIGISLAIVNDGAFNIALQINSLAFTIKPGEVLDEVFNPFTSFTITTYSTYRLWVRGFKQ